MEDVKINTKHEQGILEAISKYPIFNFKDIFIHYTACSRATAYNHNLDKLDSIKEAIYMNRRKGVVRLVTQWLNSNNATLQLAAMRLICDPDELRALNLNYTNIRVDEYNDVKPDVDFDDIKL